MDVARETKITVLGRSPSEIYRIRQTASGWAVFRFV